MNDNIFQAKLPKYKEGYEQEIVLHIAAMCLILFLIVNGWENTDLDRFFAFLFGLISIVVFYEKIYQYIVIDAIRFDKNYIFTMKNGKDINSAKLDNIGVKIDSERNGSLNRSFYDISINKKLFNFREKDMGEEESKIFLETLSQYIGCDENIFSELTYNQVVPISLNNMLDKAIQSKVQHIINQYEYKKYRWLVVPVIMVAVAMTHYILNH
ncbi:hypothetical protein [uncultured Sulfuricurvum sp.]|uniref:hypothetical protein n=1 Tax=uncultured Sulfuricurvum sp. TaxID=430693 RepID=UPI00260D8503|nr:hypothetical protein [uncultured Sulfuricurvum sp.]